MGSLETHVHRCSLPFLRRTHLLLCVHSADMGEGGWGLAGAGAVASAGGCGGAVGSVAAAGTLPLQYSY